MRDDPDNPRGYIINCDGCDVEMHGNIDTIVPPYAVDALTFSKHEYYCDKCWGRMKQAIKKAV